MPASHLRAAVFVLVVFPGISTATHADTALIDRLIERWAPLLWLAPDEKHLPISVEEFLEHVYPADVDGRSVSEDLPLGRASQSTYLVTKQNLDSLKNKSSFLYGRDPRNRPVPVYVTATGCRPCRANNTTNVANLKPCLSFHLNYWMFYPYNEGKEICFIGKFPAPLIFNRCLGRTKTLGNHVGDFEHVSISFGDDRNEPKELFLSVHETGVYYKYDRDAMVFRFDRQRATRNIVSRVRFPPFVRLFKGRPVLFAAKGSHGLWAAPGDHLYFRVPKLYDRNGHGTPWRTWEKLKVFHLGLSRSPPWMEYLGRWGNPKSNCFLHKFGICELSDGPSGILTKRQDFYC